MSRGQFLLVLAVLLLAGVEGTGMLQSAKADPESGYNIMCLDTTNNATVYQGFWGRCAEGGGSKVCELKGQWGTVREKCTAWDLAMVELTPGDTTAWKHLVRPEAGAEWYSEGYAELCLMPDRNRVVHQGFRDKCLANRGTKLCGRYGRWQAIQGTCTTDELAITVKDKYPSTKATGG